MSDTPIAAYKTLARVLIEKAGGLEAAAACLHGRVGKTRLGDYQNHNTDGVMPADVIVRLSQVTGDRSFIAMMAGAVGYGLVPEMPVPAGNAVEAVAAVMQEVNEAAQALSRGMSDGTLCDSDVAEVRRELMDAGRVAIERAASLDRPALRVVRAGDGHIA